MRARRLEIVDEYAEDERVAVYSAAGVVVVLSELASAAWSVLGEEWISVDAVAAELERRFGAPDSAGGAPAATRDALRTLAGHGLLELDER